MSSPVARSASVLRGVGTLFRVGVAAGLEEGALLERFRSSGDEAAFAALVALHGPRVLGVCRRLLRDPHEAEDAFQATFLVLARKAGAIRRPSQLGGWLHGVARRVAGKAHVARARRQRHEATAAGRGATLDRGGLGEDREGLRSILDEELDRLPEAYRQAVTLCYVEGKTVDEAARALGWPRGTVGTRLARGRERLRSRLERRGVAPALALAAPRPSLSSSLADSTTRAAIRFAADGAAVAGAVPARIVATALAVSRGMTMRKIVTIATTVLATALVGAGFFAHAAVGRPDEKPKPASAAKGDREAIQDTWIVTGCTVNGMQVEVLEAQIEGSKFEFKGDRVTVTPTVGAPGPLVFGLKIDPDAKPKALTLESIEPRPGRKMVAIYELTAGERLRIGFVDGLDPARPPDFDFKPEPPSGPMLVYELRPESKVPDPDPAEVAAKEQRVGRALSEQNLSQIALAMHQYREDLGAFPPSSINDPDGKPLLSWRVAILPYLGQRELYNRFHLDEPWDSPHNKALLGEMPERYAPYVREKKAQGATFYRVFVGPGAAFVAEKSLTDADFTDPKGATILVVEAGESVPWTKPEELPFDPEGPLPKLGGHLAGGFVLATVDGARRYVSRPVDEELLRSAIRRDDGGPENLDALGQAEP
jgi:RNA polymerase sigma-70 factor (ECF subfamily)